MKRRATILSAVVLALSFASTAWADLTVDEALDLSKKTGRPIFAVSGSPTCPNCVSLVKQINGGSLNGVLSNYIVIKLEQSTPEWTKWVTTYKSEGGSIPVLFVVRADGTQLYGKSADGLSGSALAQFLDAKLAEAGTIIPERNLAKMAEAVEKAKNHKQNEETGLAVAALAPALGTGSFAQVAIEADALGAELQKEAEAAIDAAVGKLQSSDETLEGAVEFLAAKRHFGRMPALKSVFATKQREAGSTPEAKAALKQAMAIDKAAEMAEKGNKKGAATAYRKIVDKEADSPIAEIAQARLQELGQ